jgi:hypothetical protein
MELGLSMVQYLPLAAFGDLPTTFVAVYAVGGIAAVAIGLMAVKKAKAINLENLRAENLKEDPEEKS